MATVKAGKDQDKFISALAYLVFFLPLVAAPNSKSGRYHANQGLVLLIFWIAISAIGHALPILGWFIILPIGWVITVILFLIGFSNGLSGKQKPLPLIGNFELIK